MADTKLNDLNDRTTTAGTDIVYAVSDPSGSAADNKVSLNNLFKRGEVTTSSPVIDAAQTWNAGAVTFTGLKFNVTDTASASGSNLLDIGTGGGSYVSRFSVSKGGLVTLNSGGNTVPQITFVPNSGGTFSLGMSNSGFSLTVFNGAAASFVFSSNDFVFRSDGTLRWSATTNPNSTVDVFLSRRDAANLRLGAADTTGTTAPTPQFLSAQSWASSTNNNQTGANFTIDGSQGTGTGAGGSIIFRVAPAGSTSNGVQNALVNALTIASNTDATFAGNVIAGASKSFRDASNFAVLGAARGDGGVGIYSGGQISWCDNSSAVAGTTDVVLRRDAANTLALRNSTNAQTFNIYNTFTDASNYERLRIDWASISGRVTIGPQWAGTGTAKNLYFTVLNGGFIFLQSNGATSFGRDGTGSFWDISSAGHFLASSDNTYDIGASGATRPRNVYVGTSVFTGTGGINFDVNSRIRSPADGQITLFNAALNDFGRLNFGGTTSSFPALKRSSATLQVRLADDSGDADLSAKALTLSGNLTISTKDIVTDTTTGTKIGTGTTQKIGFYNKTPVVQPTAVADATDAATVITQLNALLSRMRDLGLIAT